MGLKVMLKPHLELAEDTTKRRYQIGRDFREDDWRIWFASYEGFIKHYALFAEKKGVEQLCVGTELSATEARATEWRHIINEVRNHYSGSLTYSANFDRAGNITWWDALDYIGVNAYYPLTDLDSPCLAELKKAWRPYVAGLRRLAVEWQKPVLFTEIGYRSADGANKRPWAWTEKRPVDLGEQADAYRATFESVFEKSWLAGIYWWVWEVDAGQGGPGDDFYTPCGKPAEDILRFWYKAPSDEDDISRF